MRSVSAKANLAIQHLIEQILTSGQITRQDHRQLSSSLLSDRSITNQERTQISRIFDDVHMGRLDLVD